MRSLKRLLIFGTVACAAAAVIQELLKPKEERTWHGTVLGVPYDFRMPTLNRFIDAWWNPDDPRVFTPRSFGVGWAINIPVLLRRMQQQAEENSDDGV